MFIPEMQEYAEQIAEDECDITRIVNRIRSFHGVCNRDNVRIVKNGMHNMFWFYMLDSNAFPSWLVEKMHGTSDKLGIYIAKRTSKKTDVYERLALAADVGRIPRDLRHIAVVRTTSVDKVIPYMQRAKENLDASITMVHDESGRFDDECLIRSNEFKYVKIPKSMADDKPVTIRFMGDTPDMDNDVPLYYQYAAESYASDVICKFDRYLEPCFYELRISHQSRKYVEALSCGHESADFTNVPRSAKKPGTNVNASHNIPYVYASVFAFAESDALRKHMMMLEETAPRVRDIIKIWQRAGEMAGKDSELAKELAKLSEGGTMRADTPLSPSKFAELARKYGIDSMIEAYYAGVPLEDIVA